MTRCPGHNDLSRVAWTDPKFPLVEIVHLICGTDAHDNPICKNLPASFCTLTTISPPSFLGTINGVAVELIMGRSGRRRSNTTGCK
jgi:hypothetical protein